jgi:hypothetical protein
LSVPFRGKITGVWEIKKKICLIGLVGKISFFPLPHVQKRIPGPLVMIIKVKKLQFYSKKLLFNNV